MNLFIVIVTYNAEKWIDRCIASIRESSVQASVVVVDNCSTDQTVAILEGHYPDCILLKEPVNKGFGAANNTGIRYALEKNADYIALLNQDARLHVDCLANMQEFLVQNDSYGLVAPMFYSYDGLEMDDFLIKWTFRYDLALASDIFFRREKDIYENVFMPAAMWLMKREAIADTGLFDPLFFMYKEDDDLWQRFHDKGWKTGFMPKAIVYHYTTKQSRFTLQRRNWHTYGNMVIQLKNIRQTFFKNFLQFLWDHVKRSLSAAFSLNRSEFYVLQRSFVAILRRLPLIYKHRELCKQKGAFLVV